MSVENHLPSVQTFLVGWVPLSSFSFRKNKQRKSNISERTTATPSKRYIPKNQTVPFDKSDSLEDRTYGK